MNKESIAVRIDELNVRRKVTKRKILDLEKQLDRIDGRIEEMWNWHDTHRDTGAYGHRALEGGVRVLKVPKFSTMEEMERALSGKPAGIGEISEEETIQGRESRARFDGQELVNNLSGNSPYDKEKDADTWEGNTEA